MYRIPDFNVFVFPVISTSFFLKLIPHYKKDYNFCYLEQLHLLRQLDQKCTGCKELKVVFFIQDNKECVTGYWSESCMTENRKYPTSSYNTNVTTHFLTCECASCFNQQ